MTQERVVRRGAALVIGVGRYANDKIPPLPFTIADADSVGALLVDPTVCAFPREAVRVLKDEEARRDAIVHHISHWLPRQAAGADIAVLYFAGHGATHRLGPREEAFLVPYDANLDDLVTSGVAMSEVGRWLEGVEAKGLVLLVDCCHAGRIVTRRDAGYSPPAPDLGLRTSLLQGIAGRGRFMLASCDDGQYSLEASELGHGLFTHHLLNGIRGAADRDGDGLVGITELFEYVAATVERDSQNRFGQLQKPWYSAVGTGGVYLAAPRPIQPGPLRSFDAWQGASPEMSVPGTDRNSETDLSQSDILSLLQAIQREQNARGVPTVMQYLGSASPAVSEAARRALHAIGWARVAATIEDLSRAPDPVPMGFVLRGLAAIEASQDLVALLDRLADRLKGDLRNAAILLVERKRLGLSLEATQTLFREIRSPYRFRRALGQGLLTATYLVQDEGGEMEHVIRLLRPEFAQQPRVRGEFLDVSHRAMRLVHENLILTREVRSFPDRGVYYALRDYVEGATLRELLAARRTFSHLEALRLLRQVLDALTPAHKGGLCHGGIKPSNIFVCPGDRIFLGDLALSPHLGMHTADRLSYDFRYAPPEMMSGDRKLGPSSDLYSLGCVAYELLCGAPPFVSDSHLELAVMHAREQVVRPSEKGIALPPAAEAFILRLLARSPAARFATLGEARLVLEGVIAALSSSGDATEPIRPRSDTSLFEAADRTRLSLESPPVPQPAGVSPAAPPAAATPERIGKYRILGVIGRGGMGMVYRAQDPTLERQVALKMISGENEVTDELRARFFREAQAVARLSHPNIVTIYDMGEDDGRLFFAMELLEGEELKQIIAQRRSLSVLDKLSLMVQVCDCLQYAHQKGIIHRDIKPGNIFVLRDGQVKVLDFGIAQFSGSTKVTRTGQIMGTLRYISPEQVRGYADHRSDIFSTGAVFYELLTHRAAFPGSDPMEVLEELRSEDPPPPVAVDATIPTSLSAVIERALRKDPAKRFQHFGEMRNELETIRRQLSDRSSSPPGSDTAPDTFGAPPEPAGNEPAGDHPLHFHQNAQFTVYRPGTVRPAAWYPLLGFAHLSERPPNAPPDQPDPIAEMQRLARESLGAGVDDFQPVTQDSRQAVPADGEITFILDIPGVEFKPPRRSFQWHEPVHLEEFRLRAAPDLDGTTTRGRFAVFLGRILLAEVSLAIRVDSARSAAVESESPVVDHARRYRKIFASYSHRDQSIVDEFARYVRGLGDEFVRDIAHLRAGEVWSERLADLIGEADIFQLFWSRNSMRSPFVRQEWEHALSLRRPGFVRPTYWEEPLPAAPEEALPPESLARLHFQRLDPPARVGASGRPAREDEGTASAAVLRRVPVPAPESARGMPAQLDVPIDATTRTSPAAWPNDASPTASPAAIWWWSWGVLLGLVVSLLLFFIWRV